MLSSLPRAGSWMDWIKRGFGALMIVVGGWFLFQTAQMMIDGGGS